MGDVWTVNMHCNRKTCWKFFLFTSNGCARIFSLRDEVLDIFYLQVMDVLAIFLYVMKCWIFFG